MTLSGAVDVIRKPEMHDANSRAEATMRICDALHAAAASTSEKRPPVTRSQRPLLGSPKLSADEILPPPNFRRPVPPGELVVCIGASTGGTEALRELLCALTPEAPPIVIVQHMPKGFTAAFARRLDGLAQIKILEGEDGMPVSRGQAIIAPGDSHMLLQRKPIGYQVHVRSGPYVSRHRPSVDVLFRSGAIAAGQNAMGIILTGMGDDGAACLGEMQRCGAVTIAQDEASSVVYGMPREAARLGHARHILPLNKIAPMIMGFADGKITVGGAA